MDLSELTGDERIVAENAVLTFQAIRQAARDAKPAIFGKIQFSGLPAHHLIERDPLESNYDFRRGRASCKKDHTARNGLGNPTVPATATI